MPQAADRARWDLKVWAGSIEQLTRAARVCAERVADAVPFPKHFDPDLPWEEKAKWDDERRAEYREKEEAQRKADRAREVEIDVLEEGGFQRTLTSIDDLTMLPAEDLSRITVLDIVIGSSGRGLVPTSASIQVSRGNGLEVRIAGLNRTWTAGLRHEVQDILKPRNRLRPPLMSDNNVVLAVGLLLLSPVFAGLVALFRLVGHWPRGTSIGLAVVIALLVSTFVCSFITLPTMEVLAPGRLPRYQRWRSKILAVAAALAIGVAGSIIAALIPIGGSAQPSHPTPSQSTKTR